MSWLRVGVLAVITIFGWIITYVSRINTTEARVQNIETSQIQMQTDISNFKSTISEQLGRIEGKNDAILQYLKEHQNNK